MVPFPHVYTYDNYWLSIHVCLRVRGSILVRTPAAIRFRKETSCPEGRIAAEWNHSIFVSIDSERVIFSNHIYSNHFENVNTRMLGVTLLKMHLYRMMIDWANPVVRTYELPFETGNEKNLSRYSYLLNHVFFSFSFHLRWSFFASWLTWHHRKSIFTRRSHQ